MLASLLANKLIMVPLYAWLIAQLIKVIVDLAIERKLNLRYLVSSGGMPSSHSALVTSLAASVGKRLGLESPVFAVAVLFALVVMYDAAGVRRSVGIQAAILNRMLDEYFHQHNISEERLRELIGHTPIQVFAGAALGLAVAWLWA